MNLPNAISLGRLLAVPVTVWLMLDGRWAWALWLFVLAGVSDAIDGWLARKLNLHTQLGRYLDPMADKALLVAVFVVLAAKGLVPVWLVLLVVTRDLLIVGGALLLYMVGQPMTMDPLPISKLNTVTQIVLAGAVLLDLAYGVLPDLALTALTTAVVITTLLSGAGYVCALAKRS